MTGNEYLLKGSITKALIRFAIPVMLSSILQVLYSAVDLLIVGNFATKADMSAVAVSSQLILTVTLGVAGLTSGLSALLGQYAGEHSEDDVKKTIGTAILFFAALAAAVTLVLTLANGLLISIMKTPAEAVVSARQFLMISSFGILFIIGYNVAGNIFRGLGNSKTPLLFVAVACGVNIVLDLLFIKGFGMGAAGAALATVIAQATSLLLSMLYLLKKGVGVRITARDIRYSKPHAGKMLRIGMPISLQEILVNLSFLLITAVVNKMGVVASASVGTVERIISFLMMPTLAVSVAVATMSAHNFGARQLERARQCLWAGIRISLSFAALLCLFCWLRGDLLISAFSRDPQIVYQASQYLKSYSLDCIGVAFVFNFNGFFSSCNKSVFSMAHSLLTTFMIRVPFVLVAGGIAGVSLMTIGFGAPLTSLGSVILCLIYYLRLRHTMTDDINAPV